MMHAALDLQFGEQRRALFLFGPDADLIHGLAHQVRLVGRRTPAGRRQGVHAIVVDQRLPRQGRPGQLDAGDGAGGGQVLAAGEVVTHALQGHLAGIQVCLRAFHAAVQAAGLAHGLGQVGFGLLQGDVGITGVELHQHLALLHQVTVVGADAHYGAGDLWGDLHDVAVHVGVFGVLVPAAIKNLPGHAGEAGQHDDREQNQQPALALGIAVLDFLSGGAHVRCLVQGAAAALAWASGAGVEVVSGW